MASIPSDACTSFDFETGDQRASHNRPPSRCAICSAFLLGMIVATIGLFTVQHYSIGDGSFTKFFFAPAAPRVPRVQPVPVASVTSAGAQVSNKEDQHWGGAPPASIYQPIPSIRSHQISMSHSSALPVPHRPSRFPLSLSRLFGSHKASTDMEQPPRADEPHSYGTGNDKVVSAAAPHRSPWSLNNVLLFPARLLMNIIGGLLFLRQWQQSGDMGIVTTPSPDGPEQSQTMPVPLMARVPARSVAPTMQLAVNSFCSIKVLRNAGWKTVERLVAILAHIFPFIEINVAFAYKVLWESNNPSLMHMYTRFVYPILMLIYGTSYGPYVMFFTSVIIFIQQAMGRMNFFSRFCRFSFTQAILMSIATSMINQLTTLIPETTMKASMGVGLSNFLYVGSLFLILMSCAQIAIGVYPMFPFLSKGAKLQTYRWYEGEYKSESEGDEEQKAEPKKDGE